jgi:ribosomal protein S18 acetylase RimI-like enzyme
MFPEVSLVEVVFLAISADFQIKGYGSLLMSELKVLLQA